MLTNHCTVSSVNGLPASSPPFISCRAVPFQQSESGVCLDGCSASYPLPHKSLSLMFPFRERVRRWLTPASGLVQPVYSGCSRASPPTGIHRTCFPPPFSFGKRGLPDRPSVGVSSLLLVLLLACSSHCFIVIRSPLFMAASLFCSPESAGVSELPAPVSISCSRSSRSLLLFLAVCACVCMRACVCVF